MKTFFKVTALCLFFLSFSVSASNDCSVLESRIHIPEHFPRIPISTVSSRLYDLLDNVFTPEHPAAVLTLNGEDYLLAFEVRRAYGMGVKKFIDHFFQLPENTGSQLWRAKVVSRFADYEEYPGFYQVSSIASFHKAGSTQMFKSVEEIFFLRILHSDISVNAPHRSNFFQSVEKQGRLALVSLRIPKRVGYRPDIRTYSDPPPAPMYQSQRIPPPPNAWLQLPQENGKPVYVIKDFEERVEPGRVNGLRNVLEFYGEERRKALGEDQFSLAYAFGRPRGEFSGIISQVEYSENEKYKTIHVKSMTEATTQEMMAHDADFVEQFPEPSLELAFVKDPALKVFKIPVSLVRAYMHRNGSIEQSLKILLAQKGDHLVEGLKHLPPGFRFAISSDRIDETNYEQWKPHIPLLSKIHNARLFLFSKADDGQVYLTAMYERPK